MPNNYSEIIELLVSELGKLGDQAKIVRKNKRLIIQKAIEEYLMALNQKEQELLSLIQSKYSDLLDEQRRNELMRSPSSAQDLSILLFKAGKELQAQVKEKAEEKCYADLKKLFITGYKLVMTLREYFTNEKIEYEVAYESGNTVFEVGEEEFLAQSRTSLSSLTIGLQNGQLNIDYVQKVQIGSTLLKKAKENERNIYENLNGQNGSTFWSRGIRILHALQQEKELSGGSRGLNFGHFFETYTYYNGNEINFLPGEQPGNLEYAAAMLALRNSTEFYKGGDVGNKQLKANEATITHISTIRKQLNNILNILTSKDSVRSQLSKIRASFKDSGAESSIINVIKGKEQEILKYFDGKIGDKGIEVLLNL